MDSASEETATSSSPGKATRIQFLQIPSRLQDFQRFPQETPVLQQPAVPSSQATSTVDAIPTVPPSKQNGNSTPRQPRSIQKKYQRSSTPKAWTAEVIFFEQTFIRAQTSLFQKGRCCNMGQNDTIRKIELNPSIVLSSDNTHCKNDIQLFHQLFDELSVYRDYH